MIKHCNVTLEVTALKVGPEDQAGRKELEDFVEHHYSLESYGMRGNNHTLRSKTGAGLVHVNEGAWILKLSNGEIFIADLVGDHQAVEDAPDLYAPKEELRK